MNPPINTNGRDPQTLSQAELLALVNAHHAKYGPPKERFSANNSIPSFTDDGKGFWDLPATEANFQCFEEIAKQNPQLSRCELLEKAGAKFFADWRDSEVARRIKEDEARRNNFVEAGEAKRTGDEAQNQK